MGIKKMSTKLLLTFGIMMVVLILTAAAWTYRFTKENLYKDGISNLSQMAETTIESIDGRLTNMEQAAVDVLKDNRFIPNFLDAAEQGSDTSHREAKRILTNAYANKSDIRRVSAFTSDGYYISTGVVDATQAEIRERVAEMIAKHEFNQVNSRIFLGPHLDTWDSSSDTLVISEIKPIKNDKMEIVGYLEIQQNSFYIRNTCELKWSKNRLDTLILMSDGELFYANFAEEDKSAKYVENIAKNVKQYQKIKETSNSILATANSNYYAYKVVLVLEKRDLYRSMSDMMYTLLLVSVLLLIFAVAYTSFSTRLIMRPVYRFIERMKNTNLDNFHEHQELEKANYETAILMTTFEEMAVRLRTSMEKEEQLKDVQTKTLFSVLQSEMSPHFLYNTLGSIANLCEKGDTLLAADVCYSLTEIIRYSSNYADSEVTFKEEFDNLKSYMSIMKSRYRQRLEYHFHVDADIINFLLPKLSFQPIVENAIKYSLLEEEHVIISFFAIALGDDVIFEIKDNGCGLSSEAIELVEHRVKEFTTQGASNDMLKNIQIGGMGLSGTLIRLSIFFEDRFSYELSENNDEGGTSIQLRINFARDEG
ncbi:MAG: sensor histidine kinase [Lachnospiraceae bacterium]